MARSFAIIVVMAALAVGYSGWWQESPAVLWYRLTTSAKAMRALYTLPKQHVEDFLNSYELFDQESVNTMSDYDRQIVNYYQVVNHLCAVGEVEKMYIPPLLDSTAGVFGNQVLWEERGIADKLSLSPASKVLDMGCGRGRIAHHIASYSGAHVTGMNIDKTQIKFAREYAEATGLLGKQLDFVHGNFNDPFPFKDETFDAIYQVQVLTYAKDIEAIFREWYRVLKPGGNVSFIDWVQLPNYNDKDPEHRALMAKVKPLLGAVWTPKPEEFVKPLEKAGFKVIFNAEASEGGHQYPLTDKARDFYEPLTKFLDFLVQVRVMPEHIKRLFERLTRDGEAFVDGDKRGLWTTSWQIIAEKPKK